VQKGASLNSARSVILWLALLLVAIPAGAITLYSTAFEEFTAGDDRWAGTNGWLGSSVGAGVHGIDQDILPGLGKTAFLGFNRPKQTFVTVFRPVLYDPVTNGTPVVEFETLMGIVDSTNGLRDSFFFTFYNSAGNMLAALRFDNSDLNFGIWRLNGVSQVDTGVNFIRSELHLLFASIDFSNNRWSADLDGIPLFTEVPFNESSQTQNLGYVAAEWQLSGATTNNYGNNWMLVADWAVRAFPPTNTPCAVESLGWTVDGAPSVAWTGSIGFDYTLQYSEDLLSWSSDLTQGVYTNILSMTPLVYIDHAAVSRRFYRLQRRFAP